MGSDKHRCDDFNFSSEVFNNLEIVSAVSGSNAIQFTSIYEKKKFIQNLNRKKRQKNKESIRTEGIQFTVLHFAVFHRDVGQ